MLKKILKSSFVRRLACLIVACYIRLVLWTSHVKYLNDDLGKKALKDDRPYILSFWHGHLLLMVDCWKSKKPFYMLISKHRDGVLIAKTVSYFGIQTIYGSSSKKGKNDKGGSEAFRDMIRRLRNGDCIGMTPDGPHGPRMRASPGIIHLSHLGRADILPIVYAAKRRIVLKSWDRFVIPLPFNKILFKWGAPIAPTDSKEADQLHLENVMNQLSKDVHLELSVPYILPADKQ